MITSSANPQVKRLKKLIRSGKERDRQDVFVVEGVRMFREAPASDLEAVYATRPFVSANPDLFDKIAYEFIEEALLKEISDTKTPQGVIAIVRRRHYSLDEILEKNTNAPNGKPCLLVLERLQDPGNLGTILRTAEGAGVTGVLISRDSVDLFHPKVIRATMGAVYRIPFLHYEDTGSIISVLKEKGIRTYAASLDGTNLYREQFFGGVAFLIGNEGNGLSGEALQAARNRIRIPMRGRTESLNAAVAAAVLAYETMRQRLEGGQMDDD